jgi:hypothetical protein
VVQQVASVEHAIVRCQEIMIIAVNTFTLKSETMGAGQEVD